MDSMQLPSGPFVSVDWLAQHLGDPALRVVDCRFALGEPTLGQQQYQAGHIPGAVYLDLERDLSAPVARHGGRHPIPPVAHLAETFRRIGIQTSPPEAASWVVAYDDSRLAIAARLWWLLRYCGHDRVLLLDGGFAAWQAAGQARETTIPTPTPAVFIPQVRSDWVVTIDQVKAGRHNPRVAVVDSRDGDRFRGEREPIDPIAGHIPGAVNYDWQEVTDAQGRVQPLAYHRQRWQAIADRDEIMVYCGSGVTACVNLLSLTLAGISSGKLYAGSWSDWCSYADDPDIEIATGPA
jgi:thiosulfate/3-mercaptopyruvate sulfurtransferase